MARISDITNLNKKQIDEILWREEDPTVDPLEGLEEESDIEENLTEADSSFDSSYDESCNETSPQKAQSVRLLCITFNHIKCLFCYITVWYVLV